MAFRTGGDLRRSLHMDFFTAVPAGQGARAGDLTGAELELLLRFLRPFAELICSTCENLREQTLGAGGNALRGDSVLEGCARGFEMIAGMLQVAFDITQGPLGLFAGELAGRAQLLCSLL